MTRVTEDVNPTDPWGNEDEARDEPQVPASRARTAAPASSTPWVPPVPQAPVSAATPSAVAVRPVAWAGGMFERACAEMELGDEVAPHRLPLSFWSSSPQLQEIRSIADVRRCSPDAVLHAVLARVSAMTSPTLRADSRLDEPAGLGWYCGLYGPSGAGKGKAERAARALTPFPQGLSDLRHIDISTGQGVIAAYLELETDPTSEDGKRKVAVQRYSRGYALATEGDVLEKMAATNAGGTINGVLCKAWTGERQGTSNATVDLRREIHDGAYTLAMSLSVQQEPAAQLLTMGSIGLPQRLAWAAATLPADAGATTPGAHSVGELRLRRVQGEGSLSVTEWVVGLADVVMEIPREATEELDAQLLARAREGYEGDPLDTHEPLWRLKAASLLALLHGRTEVDETAWRLAHVMWQASCAVRRQVQDVAEATLRARDDAKRAEAVRTAVESAAATAEVVTLVEKTAARLHHYLLRADGDVSPTTARDALVNSRMKRLHREAGHDSSLWGEALAYAVEAGWVVETGDAGRLAAGSTSPTR